MLTSIVPYWNKKKKKRKKERKGERREVGGGGGGGVNVRSVYEGFNCNTDRILFVLLFLRIGWNLWSLVNVLVKYLYLSTLQTSLNFTDLFFFSQLNRNCIIKLKSSGSSDDRTDIRMFDTRELSPVSTAFFFTKFILFLINLPL